MLLVLAIALLMGALAARLDDKRQERQLVEKITSAEGAWNTVCYDYQWSPGQSYMDERAEPNGPPWLRRWLGANFFSDVRVVAYSDANDSDLQEIGRWTSLRYLNLSDSAITDDGMASISGLRNLEELYLYNTDIGDAGLACVRGSHNIAAVGLGHTRVTKTGLRVVQTWKRLSFLDLSRIELDDSGVAALENVTSLRDLDLSHNDLSDKGLIYLESMTALETLDLTGNQRITERALKRLRERLPDTRVWPIP